MIKVLIAEDEKPSARKLKAMLETVAPDFQIIDICESVEELILFLNQNTVDLIFLDIHLADGNSFEIFKNTQVQTPIIFTTAYDQYAIQAFEHNSIGYLLKPIAADKLSQAIQKFRSNYHEDTPPTIDYAQLSKAIALQQSETSFRERFMVYYRGIIKTVNTNEIAYIYAENRGVFICTHKGRIYDINQTLEQLNEELNPRVFFRANRKFIVSINAIVEAHLYSKSKLKLELKPPVDNDVIISSERASKFKQWLSK
ncbi:LytTR family DNA-binding domain-containing protein [Carboxylicivirga sp. M1479]|uniref:LytR/AlgR family response regulator transcription factor n=1 Tax=Carboxylicivirga sp. M1479 TaxID=2594476 RepID=UPI0011777FF9|nr:LytTR family DNA-binding domain-containing protein [Carboxylicivirga sp. M1479]TRX71550.1 response regulator transcription factor [Carboxylicivirga sp. M1479]